MKNLFLSAALLCATIGSANAGVITSAIIAESAAKRAEKAANANTEAAINAARGAQAPVTVTMPKSKMFDPAPEASEAESAPVINAVSVVVPGHDVIICPLANGKQWTAYQRILHERSDKRNTAFKEDVPMPDGILCAMNDSMAYGTYSTPASTIVPVQEFAERAGYKRILRKWESYDSGRGRFFILVVE